jgi:hypothetical protein
VVSLVEISEISAAETETAGVQPKPGLLVLPVTISLQALSLVENVEPAWVSLAG